MLLPPERWDRQALREGAGVIATCAVPLAVIVRFAFDDDKRSALASLLTLAMVAMFVIGSGVAAWRQERGTPLSHALVTAVGTFVVIQVVFSVIRLATGNPIGIGRIAATLALTTFAGILGGFLGSFLRSRGIHADR